MCQVYRHNLTTKSLINYHFVWSSRRKRKVLKGMVAIRLRELMEEVCPDLEVEILTLDIQPNYVHAFLDCPPTLAPHQIIHRIKAYTARHLRKEFEHLLVLPSIWTRSYLVSTSETISQEIIENYVKHQGKRG
ncbi:IS200/IS605 family transposase [Limnospira platensis]|uniref:IS200/IS605 family transposase n=1 Tax=Limnospira platensis TaxID=118562 RepID=UPI000550A022|nr:putative transposase [Arthrospira platensis C1]